MSAIEILRCVVPASPPQQASGRPWNVQTVDTVERAAKILREKFFHALVIDEAVAREFVDGLYGFWQYLFPRERILVVLPERERRRSWGVELVRVGALLEPPWDTSLAAFLDEHPAVTESAWRNFQLDPPLRLDESWLRAALTDEGPAVCRAAAISASQLLAARQPIGTAIASMLDALTPDYEITGIVAGLVHEGAETPTDLRPLAEWIGMGCPLMGIRKRAWLLLDALDIREGVKPPVPLTDLKLDGDWKLEGVSLRPGLADTLIDTPTTPPAELKCAACGANRVQQTCRQEHLEYDITTPEVVGESVEIRCDVCRVYSLFKRSF
jgi:hypothetical protein